MAKITRLTLDNNGELDRRRLNFREISGDADAPLESVGQDLRKARERKGEELDHISRLLKIRKDYLALLEEGAADSLPGRAYAIGFVRSYASYLGLDGAEYVERLKAEIAGRGDSKEPQVSSAPPSTEHLWVYGQWAVGALIVAAVLYAGYYLIVSATQSSEQPVLPVPARLAAEAGLTPSGSAPTTSAPIVAAPAPQPEPPPAVVPPAPEATPAAAAAALPKGQTYGAQNANSRITLRVHRTSRVTVQAANRFFINRTLMPGDTYVVPNVAGLTLSAPDSGAVELIVDGNSIGFAGENGVDANGLPLNPQDLAARPNRG